MAPTESTILTRYLLVPSQLTTALSLDEFTALFPRAQQASSQVRSLYRDLQSQRRAVIEDIAAGIEAEAKRGKSLHRALVSARKDAGAQDRDDELAIERALFGTDAAHRRKDLHSVLADMDGAVKDLERQIELLRSTAEELLDSVRQTVGHMSDLRYGRLANSQLRDQVDEGLASLRDTCKSTTS
ncbi:hypothetical protein P8C59_000272 [Phyllachora maydis]|uniref:Uncharacterized protein n=1 Tax=Phyllachora maydis TaxID=1825666 RepID=A0AAD9M657_9PEZI|nr:hypothetical protein P8C59_000272 [Phyllachora maydis]